MFRIGIARFGLRGRAGVWDHEIRFESQGLKCQVASHGMCETILGLGMPHQVREQIFHILDCQVTLNICVKCMGTSR